MAFFFAQRCYSPLLDWLSGKRGMAGRKPYKARVGKSRCWGSTGFQPASGRIAGRMPALHRTQSVGGGPGVDRAARPSVGPTKGIDSRLEACATTIRISGNPLPGFTKSGEEFDGAVCLRFSAAARRIKEFVGQGGLQRD